MCNNYSMEQQIIGKKFQLGKLIDFGKGSKLFHGREILTGDQVLIKTEDEEWKGKKADLQAEYDIYKLLQGSMGFHRVRFLGREDNGAMLVLDKEGSTMDELFERCNRMFTVRTVCLLGYQLLCRIQNLHCLGYIHRDICPQNVGIGRKDPSIIYITDLGSAKQSDCRNQQWINTAGFVGSSTFASQRAHCGREQCPGDDLVSLGYMLVYWLKGLPWDPIVELGERDVIAKVYRKKRDTSIDELCGQLPNAFAEYFAYCASLSFDSVPDYQYLRGLFLNLLRSGGNPLVYAFDWHFIGIKRYTKSFSKL